MPRDNPVDQVPYPIAIPYSRLDEYPGTGSGQSFEAMVVLHEAVVRTLALLALSSYMTRGPRRADLDHLIGSRIFGGAPALGDWLDVLDGVAHAQRRANSESALPEIIPFWLEASGNPSAAAQTLTRFAASRKEWQCQKLERQDRRALESGLLPDLRQVVGELGFLGRYRFLIPLVASADGAHRLRVTEAVDCRGTTLTPGPADLAVRTPLRLGEEVLVVAADEHEERLRLYPLLLPELGGGRDDLFVYERSWAARGRPGRVARIDYVGTGTRSPRSLDRSSSAAFVLDDLARRLAPWMSAEANSGSTPVETGAEYANMPELVASARTGIAGRDELLATLGQAAASDAGRLFILVGEPGAGKTAVLAALAESVPAAAVHLAGRDTGRDQPRRIARALLTQLCARFQLRRPLVEDHGGALKVLHQTLAEIGGRGERLMVVIDALDEVERAPDGSPDLSLLPVTIPPGLTLVVSIRPGELGGLVLSRPGAVRVPLDPLDEGVMRALAQSLCPSMGDRLDAILARARGNPLLLRALLQTRHAELPLTLDEAYGQIVADAVHSSPDLPVARALGLLAATRSPLARRDLARLLAITPFQAGALLHVLTPLTTKRGERVVLFHRSLGEWVGRTLVGDSASAACHADLARLLTSDLPSGRDDSAEIPYHLDASGQQAELASLLDGDFLAIRMARDGAPELVREDLCRGAASGLDVSTRARFALTAALLSRAQAVLARAGMAVEIARNGELRLALALGRALPDPDEREETLRAIATVTPSAQRTYGRAIAAEIGSGGPTSTPLERARTPAELVHDCRRLQAAANRSLRVRTLAAAARRLPPEHASRPARAALRAALEEPPSTRRQALLRIAGEGLSRLGAETARDALAELPPGLERARALVAAGLLDDGRSEASSLPDPAARATALADLVESLAAHDPAAALTLTRGIPAGLERDRALLALAETGHRPHSGEAALSIGSPALRASALGHLGAFADAGTAADQIVDGVERVAVLTRLAALARARGASTTAHAYEQRAAGGRSLLGPADQARALRDGDALARAVDPQHAPTSFDLGAAREVAFDAQRDGLLRAAGSALDQPSGAALRDLIAWCAPYGDAFAEIYPELVAAVADGFGASAPLLVEDLIQGLDDAEERVLELLLAALASTAPHAPAPARVSPELSNDLLAGTWERRPVGRSGVHAECDLLLQVVGGPAATRNDLERLIELLLLLGKRQEAVAVLCRWARDASARAQPDEAQAAHHRALAIDPLADLERAESLAPVARLWQPVPPTAAPSGPIRDHRVEALRQRLAAIDANRGTTTPVVYERLRRETLARLSELEARPANPEPASVPAAGAHLAEAAWMTTTHTLEPQELDRTPPTGLPEPVAREPDPNRARILFEAALKRVPAERSGFVEQASRGDAALVAAVEELLNHAGIELPSAAPLVPVSSPTLIVSSEDGRQTSYAIPPGTTTIGRRGENSIVIPDRTVSGRHGQLVSTPSGVDLYDLGSANGTMVNEQPLRPSAPRRLHDGDRIEIGAVQAVFRPVGDLSAWHAGQQMASTGAESSGRARRRLVCEKCKAVHLVSILRTGYRVLPCKRCKHPIPIGDVGVLGKSETAHAARPMPTDLPEPDLSRSMFDVPVATLYPRDEPRTEEVRKLDPASAKGRGGELAPPDGQRRPTGKAMPWGLLGALLAAIAAIIAVLLLWRPTSG